MTIEATLETCLSEIRALGRELADTRQEIARLNRFVEKPWTTDDVTRFTGLSKSTILRYIRDGLLTPKKIGGKNQFDQGDVVDFMTRRAS